jgi:hypothetical protein
MAGLLLSRNLALMNSPSTLTSLVAEQITGDHITAARAHRESRRNSPGRLARFRGRRSGAYQPLVPRGRTVTPFAH